MKNSEIFNFENQQKKICAKYGVEFQQLDFNLKLGVSDNYFQGVLPLNGLRHQEENGTCGWYLWAGEEFSEDADFFAPLHVYHLIEKNRKLLNIWLCPKAGDFWSQENTKTLGLMRTF